MLYRSRYGLEDVSVEPGRRFPFIVLATVERHTLPAFVAVVSYHLTERAARRVSLSRGWCKAWSNTAFQDSEVKEVSIRVGSL